MTSELTNPPTILWLRRDLRLSDHPGWAEALKGPGPVIPIFILDGQFEDYGAAPKWRLGESLSQLRTDLNQRGSRLILRRGEAAKVMTDLIAETNARRVVWSRQYDSRAIARDKGIKSLLVESGVDAVSVNGSLLFEPWTVETGTGGFYKVYTPFWKAVRHRDVRVPISAPADLKAPDTWPASDALSDWQLGSSMGRGAVSVARFAAIGECRAQDRLATFLDGPVDTYKDRRDFPAEPAVSGLSENFAQGEISPVTVWHAGVRAMEQRGHPDAAEHFLKEVVWREFAYHLLFHTPEIETRNWRPEWDSFPWREDNEDAERWRRGMTGIEMVDAGMRELYVTGVMHNRTRMLTASFLTKHLMTHWKVGEAWFRDCLIDWDPASNAMGWQWAAGCGPDAAPYFRVFNPETQGEKFDRRRAYRDRFLKSQGPRASSDARAFFDAVPRAWGLSPDDPYPAPMIELADGRARALQAYEQRAG